MSPVLDWVTTKAVVVPLEAIVAPAFPAVVIIKFDPLTGASVNAPVKDVMLGELNPSKSPVFLIVHRWVMLPPSGVV